MHFVSNLEYHELMLFLDSLDKYGAGLVNNMTFCGYFKLYMNFLGLLLAFLDIDMGR